MSLFVLAVLAGAAWYFMSPEDRARFVAALRRLADRGYIVVLATCFRPDPLMEALRARTRWLVIVPVIALVNVGVFVLMTADSTAGGQAEAMIAGIYGMNFRMMPELEWEYGYFFALAAMVIACAMLYGGFRRSGWL